MNINIIVTGRPKRACAERKSMSDWSENTEEESRDGDSDI